MTVNYARPYNGGMGPFCKRTFKYIEFAGNRYPYIDFEMGNSGNISESYTYFKAIMIDHDVDAPADMTPAIHSGLFNPGYSSYRLDHSKFDQFGRRLEL